MQDMQDMLFALQRAAADPTSVLQHSVYFRGMNLEECVAPMPGFPCLTGL